MIRCVLSTDPFACFWGMLPEWAQWGIVACVILIIGSIAWRVASIIKRLGGWPAAVGALGIVGILVGVFWPRRVDRAAEAQREEPAQVAPRKKKRKTIFD